MGIDDFNFSYKSKTRRYSEAPSNLCICGKDIANHTLKEKRACDTEN
jgi:hypothetical protein